MLNDSLSTSPTNSFDDPTCSTPQQPGEVALFHPISSSELESEVDRSSSEDTIIGSMSDMETGEDPVIGNVSDMDQSTLSSPSTQSIQSIQATHTANAEDLIIQLPKYQYYKLVFDNIDKT